MQEVPMVTLFLTWSKFVDCVKRYIDRCFTPDRRKQFNQAVQRSVDSVHQICTPTSYQKEYLSHAKCIKSTLTEEAHCGLQYRGLADIVAGQQPVTSRVHICCSHHRFRECVLRETRKQCDAGLMGSATRFATHILDKALSFLREDCTNYIPSNGECSNQEGTLPPRDIMDMSMKEREPSMLHPNTPPRNRESSRFAMGMGRSSRFPMEGGAITSYMGGVKVSTPAFPAETVETPASPPPPFNVWSPTPPSAGAFTPWIPGREQGSSTPDDTASSAGGFNFFNNMLGSSTEAPSGNGGGWNKEPTAVTWGDTSTKISGLGDGNIYVHSTESWYPEAGIHNGIIDEPNQQGLQRGGAESWTQISLILLLTLLAMVSIL
ncbi:hypothetical protein B566_EDAN008282 [Ephemera danica]|nr:hypothetical protein B566_EDAN008282 [Ephemera danica]